MVPLLDRLLDNAPCLVLQQLAIGRHEDKLQPALQDFLKRQAVAHRLRDLGVAAAHNDLLAHKDFTLDLETLVAE